MSVSTAARVKSLYSFFSKSAHQVIIGILTTDLVFWNFKKEKTVIHNDSNVQEQETKKSTLWLHAFIEKTEQNRLQKIETHPALYEILAIRRQMPTPDCVKRITREAICTYA